MLNGIHADFMQFVEPVKVFRLRVIQSLEFIDFKVIHGAGKR